MPDIDEGKSDGVEEGNEADTAAEAHGTGTERRAFVSFSMAHALSMVRRRRQEQQRTQQQQEADLEQERKERARAKRRRRRQNQKLAKAQAKAENPRAEADGDGDEQATCSDGDTCDKRFERVVESAEGDESSRGDAIKSSRNPPPARKRLKLNNPVSGLQSSSSASTSLEPENGADSAPKANPNATKLRALLPRAVMLKRGRDS